ncbi:MAG: hypothetical protein IIY79_05765, partial [Ruminococcus sp.]|nr:hypothetical protein [Ruminococcus sp.]
IKILRLLIKLSKELFNRDLSISQRTLFFGAYLHKLQNFLKFCVLTLFNLQGTRSLLPRLGDSLFTLPQREAFVKHFFRSLKRFLKKFQLVSSVASLR